MRYYRFKDTEGLRFGNSMRILMEAKEIADLEQLSSYTGLPRDFLYRLRHGQLEEVREDALLLLDDVLFSRRGRRRSAEEIMRRFLSVTESMPPKEGLWAARS